MLDSFIFPLYQCQGTFIIISCLILNKKKRMFVVLPDNDCDGLELAAGGRLQRSGGAGGNLRHQHGGAARPQRPGLVPATHAASSGQLGGINHGLGQHVRLLGELRRQRELQQSSQLPGVGEGAGVRGC